jgi:hypothetical protein
MPGIAIGAGNVELSGRGERSGGHEREPALAVGRRLPAAR